jgi:ribose 5-phosphate isomerase A
MSISAEDIKKLKQEVGIAAAQRVQSGMVVGLGTGSTTAFAIEELGRRISAGELTDIVGIPTSFQASVLGKKYGIPIRSLDDVDRVDVAIDGADEVDPHKTLIKGGGAAHTREKVVDSLASLFIVVVDESKLVDKLGSTFAVPIEVLPMAVAPVTRAVEKLGGKPELRMGVKKDGPVTLNNIPGVVENGLFVGVTDLILVGEFKDGNPQIREIS